MLSSSNLSQFIIRKTKKVRKYFPFMFIEMFISFKRVLATWTNAYYRSPQWAWLRYRQSCWPSSALPFPSPPSPPWREPAGPCAGASVSQVHAWCTSSKLEIMFCKNCSIVSHVVENTRVQKLNCRSLGRQGKESWQSQVLQLRYESPFECER